MKRLTSTILGLFVLLAAITLQPVRVEATTYTIDSLYVYGSGGRTDQSIDVSETITVVCRISAGAWNTSTPLNSFYIVPNTQNPPTVGGVQAGQATEYGNGDIDDISFTDSNQKFSFTIDAPVWNAGENSFTIFMDGRASGFGNTISTAETMVAAGGATTLLNTNPGSGIGFGYGLPIVDTTEPAFVLAGTYAVDLDTLRVQFDEVVSEVGGDCGLNFELTGDGIGGTIVGDDMINETGFVWKIHLASSLPSRDWQGTVTYDRDNSANQVEDASGNEVADGETVDPTTEQIPPAAPTMTSPLITTDLSGATVDWTGTADNGTTDSSLDYVQLQGSNDDASYVAVGTQDSNTIDTDYSGSYTIGTEYAYYRLLAVDGSGASTPGASVGSFQAAQRLVFSGDTTEPVNTDEDQITVSVNDAYGNTENVTATIGLARTSGNGDLTFRETQGGSSIGTNNAILNLTASSSTTFYYESDATGAHSMRATTAGLVADTLDVTIVAGAASQLLVLLPGESFVDGTGITGTADPQTAGNSFNVTFYITDSEGYVVDTEDSPRDLDFSSTASAGPLGDNPTINGLNSGSWNNVSISFSDGVSAAVPVVFYNDSETPTLEASDNSGSPTLSAVASNAVTVDFDSADHLVFALDNGSQESNTDWTGTNTITVLDQWGNTVTDFDASSTNITLTATPSAGVTIEVGERGDAVLDQAGDFSSGVADLTSIGVSLTGAANTYTIDGTSALAENVANTTDTIAITVNAPTVSNPIPPRLTHIDAQPGNAGVFLLADIDENGETLYIVWGFDDDSTTAAYSTAHRDSAAVISGTGTVDKYISSTTLDDGAAYDYMLFWISGSDSEGNPVDGTPIYSDPVVLLVNPTLIVEGIDVGGSMLPNTSNNLMTRINLTAEQVGATIRMTDLQLSQTSTSNATTSHISGFSLWLDDGNGTWNGSGTETLIDTDSGTINPSFTDLTVDVTNTGGASSTVLWVTVDLSANASVNQNHGLEIVSANDIEVSIATDDVAGLGGSFPQPPDAADYTLPVELSLFSAEADYGVNKLDWRTDSEENNVGFRLWRAPVESEGVTPPPSRFVALADYNSERGLLGRDTFNGTTEYAFQDRSIEPGADYCYKLESIDSDGSSNFYELVAFVSSLEQPTHFELGGNYPNPFNPDTRFDILLPEDSRVSLKIYNIQGQLVRTLSSGETLPWGRHTVRWDSRNDHGLSVASGMYIYEMKAGTYEHSRKMLLLK